MQKNYSDINMLLIRSHQFAIQDASRHSRKYNGKVFLAYVAKRDGLGLTGKATNAPTLSNAAERVAERVTGASDGIYGDMGAGSPEAACRTDGEKCGSKQNQPASVPKAPAVIKLPRLTPQQQAGCSAQLAHKVKQHHQRRHLVPAARYLEN